jgi:hypothetical protein
MDLVLEAKKELSKQLNDVMVTFLYTGIRTIWASSRESYEMDIKKDKGVLKTFQEKLSMIPRWNQNIINSEYNRLLNQSEKIEPEFIDKLIEALFISHIQVLASIKLNSKKNKLNVKIPNSKNFVHKCYIECARRFYIEPSLFEDRRNKCTSVSIQKNLSICYKIIIDCIEKTVRNTLPIRSILEEALLASESEPEKETGSIDSDSDSEEEEVKVEVKVVEEEKNGNEYILESLKNLKNELHVIKGNSLQNSLIEPGLNDDNPGTESNNEEIEIFFNGNDSDNEEPEKPIEKPIEEPSEKPSEKPSEEPSEKPIDFLNLPIVPEIVVRREFRDRTYTPPDLDSFFYSDAESE